MKNKSEYYMIKDLVELLNMFEETRPEEVQRVWGVYDIWIRENDEIIVSRNYWFIHWLLRLKKINILKLDNRIALLDNFDNNDKVLMCLSIQIDPIEYLLSILK